MITYQEQLINEYANQYAINWFKMYEGNGTTLVDSKGLSNGSINGAAWLINGGLSFDGIDDYIGLSSKMPIGEKSIYIDFEVNTTDSIQVLMSDTAGSAYNGIQIAVDIGGKIIFMLGKGVSGSPVFNATTSNVIVPKKRYKALFIWDGTTKNDGVKIYIDDFKSPIFNSTSTGIETLSPTYTTKIGRSNATTSFYSLNGKIYDIKIWSKDISQIFGTLNKTFVLNDGEYKKWTLYDYTSVLDTTISARSKLSNYFSFNETSGNVIDNKGSVIGTVSNLTRVDSVKGSALNFNGSSFVQFNNKVIPTGKKSIRFKIKVSSLPSGNQVLMDNTNTTATNYGIYFILTSEGKLLINSVANVSNNWQAYFPAISSNNIVDSQWHDILFTWDGLVGVNNVKLFVDDMIDPYTISSAIRSETVAPSFNLVLGKPTSQSSNYFIGQLDELEIYNDVITANDLFKKTMQWKTTSTSLPTSTQFIEQGMISLSSVLNRKITTLEHQATTQDITWSENGKLFKKSIDLKKYFDIRSINITN